MSSSSRHSRSAPADDDDIPEESLNETLMDRMKRRLSAMPRKTGRLSSAALDISNISSLNPQFESTRTSFNFGQDDKSTAGSQDGKSKVSSRANKNKRKSRKSKVSILDELREEDETISRKKPRLSRPSGSRTRDQDEDEDWEPEIPVEDPEDLPPRLTRHSVSFHDAGHEDPDATRIKRARAGNRSSSVVYFEEPNELSDVSMTREQARGRSTRPSESFRVTRARSVHAPEEIEEDENVDGLQKSRSGRSLMIEVDQGARRREDTSLRSALGGASVRGEPSPSKMYLMKTNQQKDDIDMISVRRSLRNSPRIDKQSDVNSRAGRHDNENLNRSKTRGSRDQSVYVPETCPDSESEDELVHDDDEMVPETQPIPGDDNVKGDEMSRSGVVKSKRKQLGSKGISKVHEDDIESDSEPVRPRQSNKSRQIAETEESDNVRSVKSGKPTTTDDSDAVSSSSQRGKTTKHQLMSDSMSDEYGGIVYANANAGQPMPRNVRKILNWSDEVSDRASPLLETISEHVSEVSGTPSNLRKEQELTPNKRRVSFGKTHSHPTVNKPSSVLQSTAGSSADKKTSSELPMELIPNDRRVSPRKRYSVQPHNDSPGTERSSARNSPGSYDNEMTSMLRKEQELTPNKQRVSPRKRYSLQPENNSRRTDKSIARSEDDEDEKTSRLRKGQDLPPNKRRVSPRKRHVRQSNNDSYTTEESIARSEDSEDERPSRLRKDQELPPNERRVSPRKRYPLQSHNDSHRTDKSIARNEDNDDGMPSTLHKDQELPHNERRVSPRKRYPVQSYNDPHRTEESGTSSEDNEDEMPSRLCKDVDYSPNKRRVSPKKRYSLQSHNDSHRTEKSGDSNSPETDETSGRHEDVTGNRSKLKDLVRPISRKKRVPVIEEDESTGEDEEMDVDSRKSPKRKEKDGDEELNSSRLPGKARRISSQHAEIDEDEETESTILRRRRKKTLSVVQEEIEEEDFGFQFDASGTGGDVDGASQDVNNEDKHDDDSVGDEGSVYEDENADAAATATDDDDVEDGSVHSTDEDIDEIRHGNNEDQHMPNRVRDAEEPHQFRAKHDEHYHNSSNRTRNQSGRFLSRSELQGQSDNGRKSVVGSSSLKVKGREEELDISDDVMEESGEEAEDEHSQVNNNSSSSSELGELSDKGRKSVVGSSSLRVVESQKELEMNGDVMEESEEDAEDEHSQVNNNSSSRTRDKSGRSTCMSSSELREQSDKGRKSVVGLSSLKVVESQKELEMNGDVMEESEEDVEDHDIEHQSSMRNKERQDVDRSRLVDGPLVSVTENHDVEELEINEDVMEESEEDVEHQDVEHQSSMRDKDRQDNGRSSLEDGHLVFVTKKNQRESKEIQLDSDGSDDSFGISGVDSHSMTKVGDKSNVDKSQAKENEEKSQADGDASQANTTTGGKKRKRRKSVPAMTVHVDVRQHMRDRDFIHEQLDVLAAPISITDPVVQNAYKRATAQNVIDEHPIPKDVIQKVFDKVNKKVYDEVHGVFNPREVQAMLCAMDEVRGSSSGAGVDVDRTEKQLVALNVERVLETLPMVWPGTSRNNPLVERYNKLRSRVSKTLTSIEEDKKENAKLKVTVDMVREVRSLQASLDMNELVDEVKRSQKLVAQFNELKKSERSMNKSRNQESYVE